MYTWIIDTHLVAIDQFACLLIRNLETMCFYEWNDSLPWKICRPLIFFVEWCWEKTFSILFCCLYIVAQDKKVVRISYNTSVWPCVASKHKTLHVMLTYSIKTRIEWIELKPIEKVEKHWIRWNQKQRQKHLYNIHEYCYHIHLHNHLHT